MGLLRLGARLGLLSHGKPSRLPRDDLHMTEDLLSFLRGTLSRRQSDGRLVTEQQSAKKKKQRDSEQFYPEV